MPCYDCRSSKFRNVDCGKEPFDLVVSMAAISGNELQDAWQKVKAMTSLPEPPELKLPSFGPQMPMKSKLFIIQNIITSLE